MSLFTTEFQHWSWNNAHNRETCSIKLNCSLRSSTSFQSSQYIEELLILLTNFLPLPIWFSNSISVWLQVAIKRIPSSLSNLRVLARYLSRISFIFTAFALLIASNIPLSSNSLYLWAEDRQEFFSCGLGLSTSPTCKYSFVTIHPTDMGHLRLSGVTYFQVNFSSLLVTDFSG